MEKRNAAIPKNMTLSTFKPFWLYPSRIECVNTCFTGKKKKGFYALALVNLLDFLFTWPEIKSLTANRHVRCDHAAMLLVCKSRMSFVLT